MFSKIKTKKIKIKLRIVKVQKEIEEPINQKIDILKQSIKELKGCINDLDIKIDENKKSLPPMIDAKAAELLKQINEFKARFEADVASAEEKDKTVQKIIEEQEFRFLCFVFF